MDPAPAQPSPPPRAFTQGVGTVFQGVGAILFLLLMATCCGSGLLSKETAERQDLSRLGWHLPGGHIYSVPRAMSVEMVVGLGLSIALATIGLGLQATRRSAGRAAATLPALGAIFWLVHLVFAIQAARSVGLSIVAALLSALFILLAILGIGAAREMRRDPPPSGHELLPADYKVPYSWYHPDPPEVRLEKELEERRRKLEVQRKELESLEEKLRNKDNNQK